MLNVSGIYYLYRPQRSCGQGNIFTPVCHSVHRGEGVCLSACWDTTPPRDQTPPGPPRADTPREQTSPSDQTPAYGLRAVGTHPTGMHSCWVMKLSGKKMSFLLRKNV